jgi:hypothetical protein
VNASEACVLKLTLVTTRSGLPKVEVTLARGSQSTGIAKTKLDPADFGVPQRLGAKPTTDDQFHLPPSFVGWLLGRLNTREHPEVLWLQLVEPFGYLALAPWENMIWEHLGVPVVRLPTVALTRRKPTNSLQVAVLAAVPNERRSNARQTQRHALRKQTSAWSHPWIPIVDDLPRLNPLRTDFSAGEVDRIVRAIVAGSPRDTTTVHVVTTPWIYADLRKMWKGVDDADWPVTLHDPYALREQVQQSRDKNAQAQVPWLRLLKAAQGGQQADVVHLICHARVNDLKTRLVLADPLDASVNVSSRYVSMTALMSTLNEVGAWSLCLSTPAETGMAPQMRYFASRFVEARPGPVLVSDLGTDPKCAEVERGYRFLFSQEPSPPPHIRHGMVACEPHRVRASLQNALALSRQVTPPEDVQPRGAVAELMEKDDTPMWLAAAQRLIEQRQVELSRLQRAASREPADAEVRAVAAGIQKALAVIQDALAERAGTVLDDG